MLIKNALVILKDGIEKADVLVKNGRIVQIGEGLTGEEILDLEGNYLAPGFVDIHNHGGYGYDYMDNSVEAFENILRFHSDNGITSAVASTVTAPKATIEKTLSVAREMVKKRGNHAKLLGVHLEGPYLSFQNKGAHASEYLRTPAEDDYRYILENSDIIRQVTISPELEGSVEFTKKLVEKGIVVSLGHDNAILPEFLPVVKAGASNLTHIFCAMSMVVMRDNKRYVGLREYGLIDDNLTAEVIADNHHITPELLKMIYRCKGGDRMCLISDCLRAGGMKADGALYSLGAKGDPDSQQFKVADGVAVLTDGKTYAGSIQPISQMLRNVVFDGGVPLSEAIKTVSSTPARIIKADKDIGSIEVGKCADFCVLNKDLFVEKTIIEGRIIKK
ncbi:MAG: N-acetylglucosamine-6-phosphate deacetylase [Clostridia bacterium]|nr:N-acetylglucosamine-6-phosphate deacetylase [Clostridia bacterium]